MRSDSDTARALLYSIRCGLSGLLIGVVPLFSASASTSDGMASIDAREQQRQQERERALQQQNAPQADARLSRPDVVLPDYPTDERPCFIINRLTLVGESADRFQWALNAAADARGRCLGSQGIVLAINKVQNAILAKGYVTTRVMAQEQDLTTGVLTLTLQPGRIGDIRFEEPVSWRGRLWNAIPASRGDILNLRDIEQGLENFRRVPSANADIKIVPGAEDGTSDLQVNWHEGRPVRLSLGLDDSGSKSTGRYLGSATLAIDAPFAQNDLFYANIGKDVFQHGLFGNRSHTLNYFFPVGYWAFSANYNDYTYHQNIPNANEVLRYSGKSDNIQLTVSRLLYRDQSHKLTLNLRGYRKHSTNAVDNVDIVSQKRRTAGWELGLNQRSYFGTTTLDANINWRRGTGAFNALPAPEESRHEGSARTGILLGDLGINQPFSWGDQPWRVYTSVRGQWSPNALTPQERMAIAGVTRCVALTANRCCPAKRACYGAMKSPGTCFLAGMNCIWPPTTAGWTAQTPATWLAINWRAARSACAARCGGDSAMTCLPAFRSTSLRGSIPPARLRVLA